MSARARTGPQIHRDLSLTIRMLLVMVLTPLVALALLAAVIVLIPAGLRIGVYLALAIGIVGAARGHQHPRQKWRGCELTESDDPELFAIVDRLCGLADIERPLLMLSGERQPNSWVVQFPRSTPRLYVTTALRELLTVDELTAVIGHELAHIANRDALVMSVVGMPSVVMGRTVVGGFGAVFVALIGMIAQVGTSTLSRYRELTADAGSAAITGRPSALASALMKVSDELGKVPSQDLRAAAALNSFNLVAVDPHLRRRGGFGRDTAGLRSRTVGRVFATHPTLQSRLDALHELERAQQRR